MIVMYAKISSLNKAYYCIYDEGRLWRVCHVTHLALLYPGIEIR